MSFARKDPRPNPTEGFRYAKPTRVEKERKFSSLSRGNQARRIGRETPEEREHKRIIRQARVCAVAKYAFSGRCRGRLEVAHLGPSGGMSAKHGDWTMSTQMCHSHHMQLDGHDRPSVFEGMTPDDLRAFKEHEIHLAREFVAGRRTVSA